MMLMFKLMCSIETCLEQPGKGWYNTGKMWDSHWDPDADKWVAYVNTGPRGVQGPQGIQGPVEPPGEGVPILVLSPTDLPTGPWCR